MPRPSSLALSAIFATFGRFLSNGWVTLGMLLATAVFCATILPASMQANAPLMSNQPLPDTLFTYTPARLRQIATAYGESGRQAYLHNAITFDLAFPLLYTATLYSLAAWLAVRPTALGIRFGWLPSLALLVLPTDLLENFFISQFMSAFPAPAFGWATMSAVFTPLKWLLVSAVALAELVGCLAVLSFVLRQANRKNQPF